MNGDFSMKEALERIAGLRRHGFTKAHLISWEDALSEYYPEQVLEAGKKLSLGWREPGDWQIADLMAVLPKSKTKTQYEPFRGFTWDAVTGGTRGDWAVFDKLPEDDRLARALALLDGLDEGDWIDHYTTAKRMHPEAVTMHRMLRDKAAEHARRKAAGEFTEAA